jgi:two-component system CheB/CheR fusion protein
MPISDSAKSKAKVKTKVATFTPAIGKDDFWIVGIGASAGGLEALTAFVRELPLNPNAAFVIAQHLAPHSKSMMVELLARQTSLPIVAVKDHTELKPGTICIIPPNFDATFEQKKIKLTQAGEETRPKPSVDVLFRSMAITWKKRAVGIVLSGTGSDGSDGVRAIKENGGVVLAQDKESAKYDGMPKATQDTGMTDEIQSAENLGKNLFQILEKFAGDGDVTQTGKISTDLTNILQYLKEHNGTDFLQYKMSTITRRVDKRVAFLGLKTLKEYYERLKKDPSEAAALAQEMLVSVTSFFRDEDAYESLTPHLSRILEQKNLPDSELRVWIAGCATGEEAYSLAILSLETCRRLGVSPAIKIFATDLDQEALTQARQGLYLPEDLKGIPEKYIPLYFERRERYFEAKKFLREMIVFARQNLIQNPPFVRLDLVSCRNVMIYFDSILQQKVFEIFQYSLKPGGFLFLGKSENAPVSMFDTIDRRAKIFRRLNPVSPIVPTLGRHASYTRETSGGAAHRAVVAPSGYAKLIPTELLKVFRLCGAVMDDQTVIQHISGDLSRYVSIPTGIADFRLSNLLSKSASTELSVLVRKAAKDKKAHRSRTYPNQNNEKSTKGFSFTVRVYQGEGEFSKPLYLVSFEPRRLTHSLPLDPSVSLHDVSGRMRELEQELSTTKEHLQTVVEELEVSNEELQSLNEELSSTNEELQASNEELETTNEELQSTNEELTTVNEELNTKSSELRITNVLAWRTFKKALALRSWWSIQI